MAGLPKLPSNAGKGVEEVTNLAKRGFQGLIGRLSGRTTGPVTQSSDRLPGQIPLFGAGDEAADTATRLSAYQRAAQARRGRQEAKRETGKPVGVVERLQSFAGGYPKTAIATGLTAGGIGVSALAPLTSLIPGIGGGSEDYNFGQIKPLSEQERYLQTQQKIIDQAYGVDPTADLQFQTEARAAADRAAMAYEKMGRPDLAEGARQEVLNTYNQARLQSMARAAGQRREALGIVQEGAADYSPTRVAPSVLRAEANQYASSYYSLPEEDRAYYASIGYDTVEKFINGKLNGEI